jgi:outer membrane protein assembly factor BamA
MKWLVKCFWMVYSLTLVGQQYQGVDIIGLEEYPKLSTILPKFQREKLPQQLKQLQWKIIENGYLSCRLDSTAQDTVTKSIHTAYFYLGEQYNWQRLIINETTKQLVSEIGFSDKQYVNRNIQPTELSRLLLKILTYYENNGFPFVQLKFDNIKVDNGRLSAEIDIDKGPLIGWGKIEIKGDDAVTPEIVKTILGLKEGDVFNQQVLNEISTRLKEIPYYEEIRPAEYEFLEGKCDVYVYVRSKNANSLNAIIGVLPSSTSKINITGDARVKLMNTLNKAEKIDVNWRKLMPLTQNLMVNFNYPFWFKSHFGSDIRFDLYKKDTSFIDLNISAGISYFVNSKLQLSGYINSRRSDIISTSLFQNINILPNFADVSTLTYGFTLDWNKLDYKYNPRSGWLAQSNLAVGTKTIRKNTALPESVYDNVLLSSSLVRGEIRIEQFLPMGKRSTLKIGANGGGILNDALFENELFRIGGIRTIRGFDEELFYASSFAIATIEYRFLLEENSALFAFVEGGGYEQNTRTYYIRNNLYSGGLGISFETKPGIFSLSYALGALQGQPVLIRTAKIHFGFVNYF